jgi:hypothetical protein
MSKLKLWGREIMKPTLEQFNAVEDVARALSALTELWNEDFENIFHQLGKDVTRDLLTVSLDEMASAWGGFRYALGDLTNSNRVCSKCGKLKSAHLVDDGGYLYC